MTDDEILSEVMAMSEAEMDAFLVREGFDFEAFNRRLDQDIQDAAEGGRGLQGER